MRIIIGADIMPTKNNVGFFLNAQSERLVDEKLKNVLDTADYRLFNLETPLTDVATPIDKNGPNFMAPAKAVNGIKALKVDFVTLANNHILDQGEQGLISTIEALMKAGINYAGAGKTLKKAQKPFILERFDEKIGIYCCAENEFSIATNKSAGANPFDPLESLEQISALKEECTYVIVLYHGGKECYRYPSPYLRKVCRKIVDSGADLVVCQHSHCVGCEEKWSDGIIVYGQGNFIFDSGSDNDCYRTGLLLEVETNGKAKADIAYIPFSNTDGITACSEEMQYVLDGFRKRSLEITQEGFVNEVYGKFAKERINDYLESFLGDRTKNPVFRILNKISRGRYFDVLIKRIYKEHNILKIKNYILCEAHRELLLKGLEEQEREECRL